MRLRARTSSGKGPAEAGGRSARTRSASSVLQSAATGFCCGGARLGACGRGWELNRDLLEASAYGNAFLVERLVESGADVQHVGRWRHFEGLTPLHVAAEFGNLEVCEWLINRRAEVNRESRDARHVTPSVLAGMAGHCDVCELLASNGAKWKADEADACLLQAVKARSLPMCRFLLEVAGADPNTRDAQGQTPLHISCTFDVQQTTRIISLATRHAQREAERSALARENSERKALCKLLTAHGADVNAADDQGRTPLYCGAGHASLAAILLKAGAATDVRAEVEEETPLHRGAHDAAFVKLLLSEGADPNAHSRYDVAPLHRAAASRSRKAVVSLLQNGAKPDWKDYNGRTALHYAAAALQRQNCATLLQHKKTNIDAKDNEGNTALMVAVLQYRVSEKAREVLAVGRYLLSRGANIHIKNHRGLDLEALALTGGIPLYDRLVAPAGTSIADDESHSEFDDHSQADTCSVSSFPALVDQQVTQRGRKPTNALSAEPAAAATRDENDDGGDGGDEAETRSLPVDADEVDPEDLPQPTAELLYFMQSIHMTRYLQALLDAGVASVGDLRNLAGTSLDGLGMKPAEKQILESAIDGIEEMDGRAGADFDIQPEPLGTAADGAASPPASPPASSAFPIDGR